MKSNIDIKQENSKKSWVLLLILVIFIVQSSAIIYGVLTPSPYEFLKNWFIVGAKVFSSFIISVFLFLGYVTAFSIPEHSRKGRWEKRVKGTSLMIVSLSLIIWLWML